jgi:hypothetical protein
VRSRIPTPIPTLAQRAGELRALRLYGSTLRFVSGRALHFRFSISPSAFGRHYDCLLRMRPDSQAPEVLVLHPDLVELAGDDEIPHIYAHVGPGTKLCLWWPKQREWVPQMKLVETCIPWTAEWLWYFEDWLATGEWTGGGKHPELSRKRQVAPGAAPVAVTD